MLSENLAFLRKRMGITQKEISERLNMARTTYSGYENGSREPDNETLDKLAKFHDVSIDYLLGRTQDEKRILADSSRKLIDMIDQELTDEEIMDKMKFRIDGIELSEDDVKLFVALVRSKRTMSKQVPAEQGANKSNL